MTETSRSLHPGSCPSDVIEPGIQPLCLNKRAATNIDSDNRAAAFDKDKPGTKQP